MASLSNNIISLRRHDLDNLRTFLSGLVIVHHTSITYGGAGNWPVKSAAFPPQSELLTLLNVVDQSFFMGLFFWTSGRMSAQALARGKPGQFLQSKITRLGLPTLFYTAFVQPVVIALAQPKWDVETVKRVFVDYWKQARNVRGPVWYPALLLVFDAIAAAAVRWGRSPIQSPAVVYQLLSKWGWLFAAVGSFLARTEYPVGTPVTVINLQPAYLSQYIVAYLLGYLSISQGDEILTSPFNITSNVWVALAISAFTFPLCVRIIPRLVAKLRKKPFGSVREQVFGGWNWVAAGYAFWNEFSFMLLGPAVMGHFQHWYNTPTTSYVWNARYSYAAFLLHACVSTGLCALIDPPLVKLTAKFPDAETLQQLGAVAATVVVGMANAGISFVLGRWLVEFVPGLKRII